MVVYITGSSIERMRSKGPGVHPSYKTKYRVINWPEYDRALVRRGDLTVWFTPSAIRGATTVIPGETALSRVLRSCRTVMATSSASVRWAGVVGGWATPSIQGGEHLLSV